MNEIPVGSPEPPAGRHAAPTGWYPDPTDERRERYWDGWQWSRDVRWADAPTPQRPAGQSTAPSASSHPSGYGSPAGAGQPTGTGQPAAPTTADGVRLAGWWHRAGAAVLDGLMLGVIFLVLSIPLLWPVLEAAWEYANQVADATAAGVAPPPELDPVSLVPPSVAIGLAALQIAVGMAWHAGSVRFRGATPGKLIAGLKVVPLDQGRSSEHLAWSACLLRAVIWVLPIALSGFALVVTLIDIILPATNPRRQALHDMAATTQVVRSR